MNETLASTTRTHHTATTVLDTPTSRPGHLARLITALGLALLVLLGLAAVNSAPASAVTWTNYGANGLSYTYPTAVGQYVTKAQTGTLSGVQVPGMLLGRSPATSGAQSVTYNIVVEKWNPTSASWVQARTDGTGNWHTFLTGARTSVPTYYIQVGQPGYYRVGVAINWFDANWRWIGARGYDLNAARDYGCRIAACQVGPGWILL